MSSLYRVVSPFPPFSGNSSAKHRSRHISHVQSYSSAKTRTHPAKQPMIPKQNPRPPCSCTRASRPLVTPLPLAAANGRSCSFAYIYASTHEEGSWPMPHPRSIIPHAHSLTLKDLGARHGHRPSSYGDTRERETKDRPRCRYPSLRSP